MVLAYSALLLACASGGVSSDAGSRSARPETTDTGAEVHAFAGFNPETFGTEPLALLPAVRISLPPALADGSGGEVLARELEQLVLDRLPEELRILHTRAPVFGFREWAGAEETGLRSGFLRSVLDWQGSPGPAGELPEVVGNSVEELGDSRGIRFFLFPRALTLLKRDTFDYVATLEAFLLDARGERVVWAGTGRAVSSLPETSPEQILSGLVRDAAIGALADIAAKLPGNETAGGERGFSDVQP